MAQLISFGASPVLSRVYGPEEFGHFGVFTAFAGVLGPVAAWRLEAAIPVAKRAEESRGLLRAAVIASLAMGILGGLGYYYSAPSFGANPDLRVSSAILMALCVAAMGAYGALAGAFIRAREMLPLAKTRVSRSSVQAAVQIVFGFISTAMTFGLAVGFVFGQTAGIGYLARKYRTSRLAAGGCERTGVVLRRYWKFPGVSAPSTAINAIGVAAPSLLMAHYFSLEDFGLIVLLNRVLGAPIGLVITSVSQAYLAEASALWRSGGDELRRFWVRTSASLVFATLPGIGLLLVFLPKLAPLLFGPEWKVGPLISLGFGLLFGARVVVVPLAQTLTIVGRQGTQAAWDGFRAMLVSSAVWLGVWMGWDVQNVVMLYGAVGAVSYVCLWMTTWRMLR